MFTRVVQLVLYAAASDDHSDVDDVSLFSFENNDDVSPSKPIDGLRREEVAESVDGGGSGDESVLSFLRGLDLSPRVRSSHSAACSLCSVENELCEERKYHHDRESVDGSGHVDDSHFSLAGKEGSEATSVPLFSFQGLDLTPRIRLSDSGAVAGGSGDQSLISFLRELDVIPGGTPGGTPFGALPTPTLTDKIVQPPRKRRKQMHMCDVPHGVECLYCRGYVRRDRPGRHACPSPDDEMTMQQLIESGHDNPLMFCVLQTFDITEVTRSRSMESIWNGSKDLKVLYGRFLAWAIESFCHAVVDDAVDPRQYEQQIVELRLFDIDLPDVKEDAKRVCEAVIKNREKKLSIVRPDALQRGEVYVRYHCVCRAMQRYLTAIDPLGVALQYQARMSCTDALASARQLMLPRDEECVQKRHDQLVKVVHDVKSDAELDVAVSVVRLNLRQRKPQVDAVDIAEKRSKAFHRASVALDAFCEKNITLDDIGSMTYVCRGCGAYLFYNEVRQGRICCRGGRVRLATIPSHGGLHMQRRFHSSNFVEHREPSSNKQSNSVRTSFLRRRLLNQLAPAVACGSAKAVSEVLRNEAHVLRSLSLSDTDAVSQAKIHWNEVHCRPSPCVYGPQGIFSKLQYQDGSIAFNNFFAYAVEHMKSDDRHNMTGLDKKHVSCVGRVEHMYYSMESDNNAAKHFQAWFLCDGWFNDDEDEEQKDQQPKRSLPKFNEYNKNVERFPSALRSINRILEHTTLKPLEPSTPRSAYAWTAVDCGNPIRQRFRTAREHMQVATEQYGEERVNCKVTFDLATKICKKSDEFDTLQATREVAVVLDGETSERSRQVEFFLKPRPYVKTDGTKKEYHTCGTVCETSPLFELLSFPLIFPLPELTHSLISKEGIVCSEKVANSSHVLIEAWSHGFYRGIPLSPGLLSITQRAVKASNRRKKAKQDAEDDADLEHVPCPETEAKEQYVTVLQYSAYHLHARRYNMFYQEYARQMAVLCCLLITSTSATLCRHGEHERFRPLRRVASARPPERDSLPHNATNKRKRVGPSWAPIPLRPTPAREVENGVFGCGRLTQKFIISLACRYEWDKLKYILNGFSTNRRKAKASEVREYVQKKPADKECGTDVNHILPASYKKGPRSQKRHCRHALAMYAKKGKPDLFITMTCNNSWPEIQENLAIIGHHPVTGAPIRERVVDRPDLTTRVFDLKLQQLLKELKAGVLGEYAGHVWVMEWQKRGLPHVHILLYLKDKWKLRHPGDVDQIVSAELPDRLKNPRLHQLVSDMMMHNDCTKKENWRPCMTRGRDGRLHCKSMFPRDFSDATLIGDDHYAVPRRRNDGKKSSPSGKGAQPLDNRWVVPYNPYLLSKFETHINVESCRSVKAVKYLFKYFFKTEPNAKVKMRKNQLAQSSELQQEIICYANGRYLGACEAASLLLGSPLKDQSCKVEDLQFHMPGEKTMFFNKEDKVVDLEHKLNTVKESQLEAYFRACQAKEEVKADGTTKVNKKHVPGAHSLCYTDMPSYCVFQHHKWKLRSGYQWSDERQQYVTPGTQVVKEPADVIGGIHTVFPSKVELFCLRLLLLNVRGATSFDSLRAGDGTFATKARQLGLVNNDAAAEETLKEVANFATPKTMRFMFCQLVMHTSVLSPRSLFDKFYNDLVSDPSLKLHERYQSGDVSDWSLANALRDMERLFAEGEGGHTLASLGLPAVNVEHLALHQAAKRCNLTDAEPDEEMFDPNVCWIKYECVQHGLVHPRYNPEGRRLNREQSAAWALVRKSIDHNEGIVFFLQGAAGTGKTFLYNHILNYVRSHRGCESGAGGIAIATATSGIASTLLEGGMTAHKQFAIPINKLNEPRERTNISENTALFTTIQKADVIVMDEAVMLDAENHELVQRTCKWVKSKVPEAIIPENGFGCTVVLGGDFRQNLPVISRRSSRKATVNATVHHASFWKDVVPLRLTQNMRQAGDRDYGDMVSLVGEGLYPHASGYKTKIRMPTALVHKFTDREDGVKVRGNYTVGDLFSFCFPDLASSVVSRNAIVAPTNASVDDINKLALSIMPGESIVSYSVDACTDDVDDALGSPENLNKLDVPGFPPHELTLKVGCVVMLLRNLATTRKLCNGTRLVVKKITDKCIICSHLDFDGLPDVFLPKITLTANQEEVGFPFTRYQFPVRVCFGMTINKSQGQTLNRVGILLYDSYCFTHGQLYVAMSRVRMGEDVRIGTPDKGGLVTNTVFPEVLSALDGKPSPYPLADPDDQRVPRALQVLKDKYGVFDAVSRCASSASSDSSWSEEKPDSDSDFGADFRENPILLGIDDDEEYEKSQILPDKLFDHHMNAAHNMCTRGLINVGSTCYINAVLQCMRSLWFTSPLPSFRESTFLNDLLSLFGQMCVPGVPLSPQCVFNALEFSSLPVQNSEQLKNFNQQHDAEEFTTLLITNLCATIPFANSSDLFLPEFDVVCRKMCTCLTCMSEWEAPCHVTESLLKLVPLAGTYDVQEALQRHFGLKYESSHRCDCCPCTGVWSWLKPVHAPEYLSVHICRYTWEGGRQKKLRNMVGSPAQLTVCECLYTLVACCYHVGTESHGHYYADVRCGSGEWVRCDDSSVTSCTVPELSDRSVLVFYRRVQTQDAVEHDAFMDVELDDFMEPE